MTEYPFATLPDYLSPGLKLVFVGINPSIFAVQRGHYFARTTNRFWPGLSRSRLSAPIRQSLGRETLRPDDDGLLLRFGIGFTDVVKVPSRNVAALARADFAEWTPHLVERLRACAPEVACFHGVTGFRAFARYGLGLEEDGFGLGPQALTLGQTRLFLVPNPSPANAHYRLQDQIAWYDRLADYLHGLGRDGPYFRADVSRSG